MCIPADLLPKRAWEAVHENEDNNEELWEIAWEIKQLQVPRGSAFLLNLVMAVIATGIPKGSLPFRKVGRLSDFHGLIS